MPQDFDQQIPSDEAARRDETMSSSALAGRRLLFVVNVAWFFLSHRLAIAAAARDGGMDVHLAADVEDPSEEAAVEAAGVTFHRIGLSRSGIGPSGEVTTLAGLARVMKSLRPDVVHNVTAKPVIYGSVVAKALRVRGIVNAVSGFGYAYGGAGDRKTIASAMDRAYRFAFGGDRVRVVVQNSEDAAEVVRICPAAAGRIRLVRGSGVDLGRFAPSDEPQGDPVVVMTARMLRDKGVVEFCEAAGNLLRSGIRARFLLAGRVDPSNRTAFSATELTELCRRTGAEWVGDCRDVPELLRRCHIVCLPTYYREGVPKALLEACATQRPIVATDMVGCRDVVQDGVNGLLVQSRSIESLVVALGRLIADPALRRRMGRAGRARAEQEFDVRQVVHRHMKIYQELSEPADVRK